MGSNLSMNQGLPIRKLGLLIIETTLNPKKEPTVTRSGYKPWRHSFFFRRFLGPLGSCWGLGGRRHLRIPVFFLQAPFPQSRSRCRVHNRFITVGVDSRLCRREDLFK